MTKDEIIKIAKQAGFADGVPEIIGILVFDNFAKLVAEKEREACAKLCDEAKAGRLAEQIRARGQA